MIIPENIITKGLNSFIAFAIASYTADVTSDKSNNVLYDLFFVDDNGDEPGIDTFNYYTQSVAILTKPNTEPRQLQIFQGYNQQRAGLPTVHVLLPSESKGRQDSIGDSVGDPAVIYNSTTQIITLTKQKSFAPTYNLMITSGNSSEVLLIYYFLRAMFILFDEHFELKGLRDVKFSGADIAFQPDLPPGIFHRNLSLSFDYLIDIKVSYPSAINNGLTVQATICED
jgi:hypothetical protein